MNKLSPIGLGNGMGLFVLVLHPFFHIWCAFSPKTYVLMVHLFFPGIVPQVTAFDYSIKVTIIAVLLKAAVFWGIGFCVASIYNITTTKK